MHWDWQSRCLRLSVGELSRLSLLTAPEEGAGMWRMELGSRWHKVLRERTLASEQGWTFEHPVAGRIEQNGWQFELRGRIDQLRHEDVPLVREVKTTAMDLPANETDLRQRYPHYFHQAMLYAFLLGQESSFPQVELLFLEIQTGLTQTVALDETDLDNLHQHLLAVVGALEERQRHFGRIRQLRVPDPFPEWRPGQKEAREDLQKAAESARVCLFEAPTGFGKTGLALELALHSMASGEVDRILLLTGKNTGHAPLLKQLKTFQDAGHGLAIHCLRSRRDLTVEEDTERRMTALEILENWTGANLSAASLLEGNILSIDELKSMGQQYGIPPWALSRMLLPYADVWIADFNYLFDPGVCQVLQHIPTFDPERTLLIVDEAHNLPERAAASRSHLLDAGELDTVLSEIQMARFPSSLARLLDHLLSMVKRQTACDCLDPAREADLLGLLPEVQQALRESPIGDDELSPESLEWLWGIGSLLEDWDHPHLSMLASAPTKGRILLSCLDASAVVGPILQSFARTILMSATLRPWFDYRRETGLLESTDIATVTGLAPWLDGAFEVWVDARVDTRYRQRDRYIDTTARTIGESTLSQQGCSLVFFPSYQYAEKVRERLNFLYPALRCVIQPRDLPLEDQQRFLELALLAEDVLFLVLGSRFSEGIDALGGQFGQAIVVSPALPEVNSRQKARQEAMPGSGPDAFRSIYLVPGLRKISQALGRLVRDPSHSARILLHGKRFLEPEYQALLPNYMRPCGSISTDREFAQKWLRGGKIS